MRRSQIVQSFYCDICNGGGTTFLSEIIAHIERHLNGDLATNFFVLTSSESSDSSDDETPQTPPSAGNNSPMSQSDEEDESD